MTSALPAPPLKTARGRWRRLNPKKSGGWSSPEDKRIKNNVIVRRYFLSAEAGGFEPPVPVKGRQFFEDPVRKRRGRDSNSRGSYEPSGFQDRFLQPLRHPSASLRGTAATLNRSVTPPLPYIKCLFMNALPDPDFKYFSNSNALCLLRIAK